jgi:uncharacterized protein YdhG (YjbR/CyaY superfamily)
MKKLQSQPSALDDYISGSPETVRGVLQQVRATIRKAAPEAAETIKYGIPTFVLGENLVHFAAFKKHIGFYPTPSAIAAFREQLVGVQECEGLGAVSARVADAIEAHRANGSLPC